MIGHRSTGPGSVGRHRTEGGSRPVRRRIGWSALALAAAVSSGTLPFHAVLAAPIPVADLVRGFDFFFQYAFSPDGRYLLRSSLKDGRLELFPVTRSGGLGAPTELTPRGLRHPFWSRDGHRLYGVHHREGAFFVRVIDPAKPEAPSRDVALPGVAGRVAFASQHPVRDDQLLVRTLGRNGEDQLHCGLDAEGCSSVLPASDGPGGWSYWLDEEGQPAARLRFTAARYELQSRQGEAWRTVGETQSDRYLAPLSPIDSDGWGLVLSNLVHDTLSLVRRNVHTLEERMVFSRPDADVALAMLSHDHRPLAVLSFPGLPVTTALDPAAERALALVRTRHPGPAMLSIQSADRALERFVVVVFDEVRARVVHLVTLPQGTVEEIEASEAGIRFREDFSSTRAVRIPARDGLSLPALLTMPRDPQGDGPPPLVLMVHGGPWAAYRWTFDPFSQLLASRGYAVLRLNYRGSSGYGNRFREAAVGELAGRAQDDVEDAFDWAVREGYADRSRLAMYGDSFGGFSVLTAMIRGRLPVRAGVVLAGVVDTEAMVEENVFSSSGRALWAKYLETDDVEEMKRILRAVSPLRNVDRIRAPVLLVTGNTDRVVQSRHAATLARELRERGGVAELVTFPQEGHSVRKEENVIRMYRETMEFLARHLD